MTERIVFPDAAEIVLAHLATAIPDVPFGTRVPSPRPDVFVVVRRTGGVRSSVVLETAQLAVEAWGGDEAEAADLAQEVRSYLLAMQGEVVGSVPVYKVEDIGGPSDVPDELSDQPRYLFAIEVTLRGTAA